MDTDKILTPNPPSHKKKAQKCDDNASLHAMVADASSHHVNDSSQWSEALAKLRVGKIISIAVGEALNTVLPRPKLGALAFFIKQDDKSRVGNLYLLELSLIDEELKRQIFVDLAEVFKRPSKRLLIYQESIFKMDEFFFLRDGRWDDRWILDLSRTVHGPQRRPVTMDVMCEIVTGDGSGMCNRTRHTMWSKTPPYGGKLSIIALQHLGIRSVVGLEYAIRAPSIIKSPEINDLRQTLVAEWKQRYA